MPKTIITESEKETKELAKKLAKVFLEKKFRVLALKGDLGGGKTTFVQGFAGGLGIKEDILSPTFIIFKKFFLKDKTFYHFDCYRIKESKELLDLGFEEIINNKNNIIAIEWAEKIEDILPEDILTLEFHFLEENKRKIIFSSDVL